MRPVYDAAPVRMGWVGFRVSLCLSVRFVSPFMCSTNYGSCDTEINRISISAACCVVFAATYAA